MNTYLKSGRFCPFRKLCCRFSWSDNRKKLPEWSETSRSGSGADCWCWCDVMSIKKRMQKCKKTQKVTNTNRLKGKVRNYKKGIKFMNLKLTLLMWIYMRFTWNPLQWYCCWHENWKASRTIFWFGVLMSVTSNFKNIRGFISSSNADHFPLLLT